MLVYLLQGITYGFAAAVTPGPLSMYLISQAIRNGWRRALPVAFSPLVSDGPIAIIILAVLSRVPAALVIYLRLLGGVFILYLAFGAWKAWRNFNSEKPILPESNPNSLFKAALVNWLNPNPYIGWSLIMGPILLSGWRASPPKGIAFVTGFYVVFISCMIGMILLFAAARTFGLRVRKSLIGWSAIGLACFGFYQLWLGSTALLG